MTRLIGVGLQVNIPRAFKSDKDWFGRGFDKEDWRHQIKTDEAKYEDNWGGKNPTRPKRAHERTKMAELAHEFRGAR